MTIICVSLSTIYYTIDLHGRVNLYILSGAKKTTDDSKSPHDPLNMGKYGDMETETTWQLDLSRQ